MGYVTHTHKSCRRESLFFFKGWHAMSHTWMGHTHERVTRMNASHTWMRHRRWIHSNDRARVMSITGMSHVIQMNESCHTHTHTSSRLFGMSHVTHTAEPFQVTSINESCDTHEWVISHTWMSHTWMSHVTHTHMSSRRKFPRWRGLGESRPNFCCR